MRSSPLARAAKALALFGALAGCAPPDDATLAHSASATSTSGATEASATATTSSTSTGTTTDATTLDTTTEAPCTFLACSGPGDLPPHVDCSVFTQDCPPGEKCMPWASDGGGAWNDDKCVPVVADPDVLGEPCQVEENGVSGLDTCDKGLMCWNVDFETLMGTCHALCSGSDQLCSKDPEGCCPVGSVCAIHAGGWLAICLETCDPLVDDCLGSEDACYPVGTSFQCAPDVSGAMGAAGDPCEFINVCDPGTYCGDPSAFPGCDANAGGCCIPFCPLDAPMCPPETECMPWYEDDPPPNYTNLGVCVIPG